MTATQRYLAGLSGFVFRAPGWHRSLSFAVLIAGLTGVAVFDSSATMAADSRLLLLGQDAWQGIVFIGVPTIVAMFLTTAVDTRLGGRLTYNRSSLLALICEVVLVLVLVLAGVLSLLFGFGQRFVFDALVVGLAAIFALRLLVIVAVSRIGFLMATIPASIQSGVAAVLVFVYSGTVQFMTAGGPLTDAYVRPFLARGASGPPAFQAVTPDHFLLLGLVSTLNLVAVWWFLRAIDRPWRRSLGVSGLDLLRGFVGHAAEGSRELEACFEQLGQSVEVPVSVISIRDRSPHDDAVNQHSDTTSRAPDPERARIVLPMVHPGPMGEIGGGNLPARIATDADGLAFPFHATAGHDFNLVSEAEVGRILDAADRAYTGIDYSSTATPGIRRTRGDATVLGQRFGEDALAIASFGSEGPDRLESTRPEANGLGADGLGTDGPEISGHGTDGHGTDGHGTDGHGTDGQPTAARGTDNEASDVPIGADDVDFGVGLAARNEARVAGLEDVLLADAHNCHGGVAATPDAQVTPGSRRSFELSEALGALGTGLADTPTDELAVGVAHDPTEWTPADGIGPLGVRVLLTSVADRETAYVLIDGNNMVPGLRTRLRDRLRQATAVDEVEIATTDTHVVNAVDADNRVGARIDHDAIEEVVIDLLVAARADCSPAEAGVNTERVTVTVFGTDRTETLASHANAVVSLGGALAAAVVISTVVLSLLLFLLTTSSVPHP